MSHSLQPHGLQHARLPCPSLSPGVCSHSCPLNPWCYLIISSSVTPFFFCFQSFPASGSFPVNQLFALGGQSIGTSASVSVLPMNIQGWFPSGLTGFISLQPEGLSRVFSRTTVRSINSLALSLLYGPTLTFVSVQLLSHIRLFATLWTTACQASLSITNSRSPPKPMSIVSVMPSNHLILCRPLLLLPSIFPSIRVFSNESTLCMRWPKYWSLSFNISPSN